MNFVDGLEEQYEKVLAGLENYLAEYDTSHDDWRLSQMHWMLNVIRHLRQVFGNVIYPELDRVEGAEALLQKARVEDALLEDLMMVGILNIHVDEPYHEHKSKMEDLHAILKRLHKIDTVLLSNFKKFVSESRVQEIDRVLSEKTFEDLSVASASLKKAP